MRGFHSVRPSHRSFLLIVFHIPFAFLDFLCSWFFLFLSFLYLLRFPFHINFLNCSLQSHFLFYGFRLILFFFFFHFLLFIHFFYLHLYFSFLLISLVFPWLSFLHGIIFRINSFCASLQLRICFPLILFFFLILIFLCSFNLYFSLSFSLKIMF